MSDRATEALEALLVMLNSMSEDAARLSHNIDVVVGVVKRLAEPEP